MPQFVAMSSHVCNDGNADPHSPSRSYLIIRVITSRIEVEMFSFKPGNIFIESSSILCE